MGKYNRFHGTPWDNWIHCPSCGIDYDPSNEYCPECKYIYEPEERDDDDDNV